MRLLVTGAAGFTGTFLAEYLSHETGVEVTGLIRKYFSKGSPATHNLHYCRSA